MNDFENINGDEDVNIHQQAQPQKSAVPIVDMDYYETPSSLLDPQMAAYRAIMSRMVPFANNESSQGEESNSSSPLNEQLSP